MAKYIILLVGDRRRNFHLRPKPKHSAKNRRLRPKSSAEVFHIKKVEFWVCGVKFFLQHLVFKVLELSSFRKGIFLPLKNYWINFFSEIFPKPEFLLTKILKIFGRTVGFLRLRSPTKRGKNSNQPLKKNTQKLSPWNLQIKNSQIQE